MTDEVKAIRVIFAGGGTGGHVYPAVAMYEALIERLGKDQVAALFVGAKGGLESRLLDGRGVDLKLLPGRGVRGASLASKLVVPFDLLRGVAAGIRSIRSFRPDVVVGTGGYASVSMVIAAILTRIPRILQEQNSVPGLVNRRLARFADLVLLAFTESRSAIPGGADAAVIGNPLRRLPYPDRAAAARRFGFSPDRPTVLVVGGSRGARSLNTAALEAVRLLGERGEVQFLLLTGELEYERIKRGAAELGDRIRVHAYVEDVQHAYAVADVAVARAGASSVCELAAFAVPSILVPYPHAADDHQRLNAEAVQKAGGALVIADSDLTGRRLTDEIEGLLQDESRRERMKTALKEWVKEDSARIAADHIVELVKKNAAPATERVGSREGLERAGMNAVAEVQ
ncbi:MAG: undecaprenyldiphospho-muramoylpentapeptide beta-N-acetylglucosaminyltransferase [Candidatus Latescibacterota bacterium]|jgi:UDP-N-acetylglucosamine--N-acetylmuramyl-(pentapeptide) pyrophosphoryl-undecaprenol N-acetylglucosamine transferase